tara:strand:- start:32 stop:301 length:270 start_codon:yes stop_codon:yes gene_type:complete
MEIGTVVRNEYQGIIRYGKVSATFKGVHNWTWCEVDWIDDNQYNEAISYRNKLSGKDHGRTLYRVDELKQFDLNKTIKTLLKLQTTNAE